MYFSIRKGNLVLINFDFIFFFLDFNNVFMFINLFVIISQNEDIVFGIVLYILMLFDVDVGVMLLYIMIVNLFVYFGLFMFVINSEFNISGFCVFVCFVFLNCIFLNFRILNFFDISLLQFYFQFLLYMYIFSFVVVFDGGLDF